MADKEKTLKPETKSTINGESWKKRIEHLIGKVDCECTKRVLTPRKEIAVVIIIGFYIVALIILIYELLTILSGFATYIGTLKTSEEILGFLVGQEVGYVALGVSIVAVVFSAFPVILAFPKTTREELAEWYYFKLLKGINVNDRPYLKAIINMKCKEFDLNLPRIYQTNPELFNQESLLRRLYD